MNLKLDQHGLAFEKSVRKSKEGQKGMSMDRPTIIYFEIYMYLRAHRGAWLHTSESCIGDIRPGPARVRHDNARGDEYTR